MYSTLNEHIQNMILAHGGRLRNCNCVSDCVIFRLRDGHCTCQFPYFCDEKQTQKSNVNENQNQIENGILQASTLELENVHDVYNQIANHFSETRHSPWPQVKAFVLAFEPGSVLLDIGCGNGKYLHLNENIAKVNHQLSF